MSPLIERTITDEKLERYFNELSDRCEKIVDVGSVVFDWVMKKKTHADDDAPLDLLFRQAVEILDAITIQIRHQSIEPCKIFLRSLFEILLSIQYLTEKDQLRRARCFLFFLYHSQLKNDKRYDQTDPAGQKFFSDLAKDKVVGNKFFRNEERFKEMLHFRISNTELLLKQERFETVKEEFERLKGMKKKFNWYSFFNGPMNIYMLSERMGMIAFYLILYKSWSTYAHGEDPLTGNLSLDKNNEGQIILLRYGINALVVVRFFYLFAQKIYEQIVRHYCVEKEKALKMKLHSLTQSIEKYLIRHPLKKQ